MKNFKTYGQFLTEAYSDEERKELADKGFSLSDGSFPIKDLKDLKNAIQAYGRAKDQARAAKFIVKRAKALGAEDLIPDTEDFQKSLDESVVTEGLDKNKPYFDFLVALRDSGATNMFGATPYLQDAFGLSKSEARKILAEWMKSFNEGKLTEARGSITEGTDIGSWNQGGLKGDKNVLVTTFVGPKGIEDFGLGRKCMQINVGMDYVSLNPADIVELKDLLKSYKVK